MGNCLAYRGMKNNCEANSGAVIMKNHGKVVERVKAMLMDMCSNGGLPFPLRQELKFGHVDDHDHLDITLSPGSPDPDPQLLIPSGGGGKRIKLMFTKQELRELLFINKVSVEDCDMVLGITEKEARAINTTTGSGWKSVLETIPEGSEYVHS